MMAWFGDSFNQFTNLTGQISSFTKEVLSETTEEVEDPIAELQVARKKISELEEINEHVKTEYEKLKAHCEEVSERLETSEYQISTISQEYRKLLQEKEEELKRCRADNERLREEHKHLVHDSTAQSPLKELAGGKFFENGGGFETVDLGEGEGEWMGDFHDFSDVVTSQGVINQLQNDLVRLKVECQHWKDVAAVQTTDSGDSDHLREKEWKDLQVSLTREVEQHKREMSSMQAAHAEKLQSLTTSHQQELEHLKTQLGNSDSSWKTRCAELDEEVAQLKETVNEQQRVEQELQALSKLNSQLQDELLALKSEKKRIEGRLVESVSALEREKELQGKKVESEKLQLQTKFGNLHTSITHHKNEISKLQQEHCQSQSEIKQLRTNIQTLEEQVAQKEAEIHTLRQAGNQQVETETQLQSSHDHPDSDNVELSSLREQVKVLQETATGNAKEKESLEHRIRTLEADKQQLAKQLQDKEQEVLELSTNLSSVRGQLSERDLSQQTQLSGLEELRVSKEALVSELDKKREECVKYTKQLGQLKAHLLEVEEGYTQEALKADEREAALHQELTELKERLIAASQDNEQSQALMEQLSRAQDDLQAMIEQRDDALLQMSNAQEQAHQNATALRNLQTVLEQFQRDQSSELAQALKRSQLELADVRSECSLLQIKLKEAEHLGEEMVSLRHELTGKNQNMEQLQKALEGVTQALEAEKKERLKLSSDNVERVDRALVKNFVLGYVHATDAKKPEVLQLISRILGFTEEELAQAVGRGRGKGWLSSLWGGPPLQDQQEPLSQLFVKFLENESSPHQTMPTTTPISGYVDSRTDPDRPSLATATLIAPPINTGAPRPQPSPSAHNTGASRPQTSPSAHNTGVPRPQTSPSAQSTTPSTASESTVTKQSTILSSVLSS